MAMLNNQMVIPKKKHETSLDSWELYFQTNTHAGSTVSARLQMPLYFSGQLVKKKR